MAKRKETVTEQLRAAMQASGKTGYALWKATGISQSTLSRFARGIGVLKADAIDALAAELGLTLTHNPGKARKGRRDGKHRQ